MTPNEAEILAAIQALSVAIHQQTGTGTAYSSYTTELDGKLNLHASVTFMPGDQAPWSMRGTNSPFRADAELSLEGLRDRLAEWIPAHRKQEAAA